jgi:hypothetical protein
MYGNNNNIRTGNQMAPQYIPNTLGKKPLDIRKYLSGVPREVANLEAEGGETVLIPNKQGGPAHYNIKGKRHFQGGVPLAIPAESFVFSDTRAMKIKDPVQLAEFGMPEKKGGYTPAEIAKKYDINTYRKILADVNSDALQVSTAEQVIGNYNVKLAKLALIQESMKGFPGGLPTVAMPYLAKYQLDPSLFMPTDLQPEQPQQPQQGMPSAPDDEMMEMQQGAMDNEQSEMMAPQMPMARRGGQMSHLRQYAPGGTTGEPDPNAVVYDNPRKQRRAERRAQRDGEREYYDKVYKQLLNEVINEPSRSSQTNSNDADPSTGIFVRTDANGAVYYVDGYGTKIKDFVKYGPTTTTEPTVELKEGESIVVKNGKKYIVKKVVKPAVDANTKIVSKDKAVNSGDVYEEDGKYYKVSSYDPTKPIASTKSGKANYTGNLEEDKVKANEILQRLQKEGVATYNEKPWKEGDKTYNAGWDIKAGARNKMTTAEKDFLTKFLSYGAESKVLGVPEEKEYQVSVQRPDEGFYGYTDPNFYEYRFWKARNPNGTPEQWEALPEASIGDVDGKTANRKNMFYSLGMDINDSHIKANIADPKKLYDEAFVKGNKRVKTSREIKDADGRVVTNLNYVDAVENFFKPGEFRPGLSDDKKLGLEHADAFTFDRKADPLNPTETEESRLLDPTIKQAESPDYNKGDEYTPFWLQDRLRNANAAQNYFNINKYYPSLQTMSPALPNVTYYNPEQENYANVSAARGAMDVARAVSGSSQALGARASETQGKLAEIIGQTMGRYNGLNVNTANEYSYKVADILNQSQARNKQNIQTYVDQVNTLNQNYDNAKRDAGAKWTEALSDAYTNRSKTQVLNAMYPNYHIDPASGGDMDFIKGRDIIANENANSVASDAEAFAQFMRDNPDIDANAAAAVWTKGKSKTMMDPQNQAYFNAYNESAPAAGNPATYAAGENPNYYQKQGGPVPYNYLIGAF